MRAGRCDIVVETGARWERDFQWVEPAVAVPASTVLIGERIYVDSVPLKVYSIEPLNSGLVRFTFGHGLWNDPTITVSSTALVVPAEPITMDAVEAAIHATLDPEAGPDTIPIVATLSADKLSCGLLLDADTTTTFDAIVGAHSWDVYAQAPGYDWQRILEGTATIIDGDAR